MSASIHTNSVASPITSPNVYSGEVPMGPNNPNSEFGPLPQHIARGLNDRMYEKRKQAALEIERYQYYVWQDDFEFMKI